MFDPIFSTASEVRAAYNGDIALPLPELAANEKASVANLLQLGVDATAQRIASTVPDVRCPPVRPGVKSSEILSRTRRRAILCWWEQNDMMIRLGRRARHLIAYASSPVMIRPDFVRGLPCWEVRDPLSCFPASSGMMDDPCPTDVIFSFRRSLGWLQARFPDQVARLRVGSVSPRPEDLFEVVEFVDAEQLTMFVVGRSDEVPPGGRWVVDSERYNSSQLVTLTDLVNRAGVCTAVVPGRTGLDRPKGQFDGMLGLFYNQARLAALELIAIERGVFPEEWLVARPGEHAKIVTVADGRQGVLGVVEGGALQQTNVNPGYKTDQAIDRLERAQRLEGAVPAEFGGESTSNIRTGRRGDQVLAAAVDFNIQEAQRLLSSSLEKENCRAIAVAKAYFGSQPKSFFVSWSKASGPVDYVPNVVFETDRNVVRYALAGSDLNAQTVRIGQKIGTGILSTQSGREMDPEIDDPETEHDRIISESIERSVLAALQAQAQQGALPLVDAARIQQLVLKDRVELVEAVLTAQREAQDRQAQQVPVGAPEAQPGLSQPGMGVEASAVPATSPSQGNLAQLLNQLRTGRSQIAAGARLDAGQRVDGGQL